MQVMLPGPTVEIEALQHVAAAITGEHAFEIDHRAADPVSSSTKSSPR